MWMLLSLKLRLILLVVTITIFAIIYATISLHASTPATNFGLDFRLASALFSGIGATAFLIIFVGPWPIAWQLTLKLPYATRLIKFPDVNGVWAGVRESSYLNDEAARNQVAGPRPGGMQMTIRQSWLSVRVDTVSADGRTVSRSVFAFPELPLQRPRIWSTYDSLVLSGAKSDRGHQGAAVLNITDAGDRIRGTYFSDRGIAEFRPSSGRFDLLRFCPDPDRRFTEAEITAFVQQHQDDWELK